MSTEKLSNEAENHALNKGAVITSAFMTVMTSDNDCPKQIPFAMLSERMAESVHSQTLTRLNERGGMSPAEIIGNIEKINLFKYPHDIHDESYFIAKLKKYLQLYESGEF